MRIPSSLFLIIVGAILAFAVHLRLGALDLRTAGWIILLVGIGSFWIALWRLNTVRRRVVDVRRPDGRIQREVEEERMDSPPGPDPPDY